MPSGDLESAQLERVLSRPIADSRRAIWGFQNRTDIVTLTDGERVVVQRYRRRQDAEYRLRVMQGLWAPAAAAGVAIPRIRESDLAADPAWLIFDALPGVPVPDAGDSAPGGPRFPAIARLMGELLAAFRGLPSDGVPIDDRWADPGRLAAHATRWVAEVPELKPSERAAAADHVDRLHTRFGGRPAVLAHGDFAPVNVLTDGRSLTGLLDFESVRLADPLFDLAWWEWSVGFSSQAVLKAARPAFLEGAGIDATDPELPLLVQSLQLLRMLELLAGDTLGPDVRAIVAARLHATIRRTSVKARRSGSTDSRP